MAHSVSNDVAGDAGVIQPPVKLCSVTLDADDAFRAGRILLGHDKLLTVEEVVSISKRVGEQLIAAARVEMAWRPADGVTS